SRNRAGDETSGPEYPSAAATHPSGPSNRSPQAPCQNLHGSQTEPATRNRTNFTPLDKRVIIVASGPAYSNSMKDTFAISSPASAWATECAPHMATSVAKS